ncbi:hypothetical protein TRFO_32164 [Tritrichomonas foetus]|uniref:Uncharacterized protein n=1 Tax=Tritrichomonas foetus TaxID=1144522 RepID=A0A1J4JTX2_9EUKA|nr:hypothetical protein TRFO_32164 [Tritrichomonas foetus]|eukprot:OHT00958.1 hypothetical protein TRFO_32164 [Tritrichomonas foetus]
MKQQVTNDILFAIESSKEIPGLFENPQPAVVPIPKVTSTLVEIDSSSDDDDDEIAQKVRALEQIQTKDEITGPIRSVHEKPLDQIEVGEIPAEISPDAEMIPIAVVSHWTGNFSIARSFNEKGVAPGSLLADCNRKPITRVIELFGPISNPQIILKGQIPIGTELFAVLQDSEIPDPEQIAKQFRGCDASNRFDEEAPYQDFSDDEEEREYKKRMKLSRKGKSGNDQEDEPKIGYQRDYGTFQ